MAAVDLNARFELDNKVIVTARTFIADMKREGLEVVLISQHERFNQTATVTRNFLIPNVELGVLKAWIDSSKRPKLTFITGDSRHSLEMTDRTVKISNWAFDGYVEKEYEETLSRDDYTKVANTIMGALRETKSF